MLSKAHVLAALRAREQSFAGYELRSGEELRHLQEALALLATLSHDQVEVRLAGAPRPGARPTAERVAHRDVVWPFGGAEAVGVPWSAGVPSSAGVLPSALEASLQVLPLAVGENGGGVLSAGPPGAGGRWTSHEQARAWALQTLRGVTTVAVDGSQITPSRDFSIPVGAVQVGWFENPHDEGLPYAKDILFEALAPEQLAGDAEEGQFPDLRVNLRRFQLECRALVEAMERHAGAAAAPVCFFDGSLMVSFTRHMRPDLRLSYLDAVRGVLATSLRTRVPVVGYVDNSFAGDLVAMLSHLWPGLRRDPHLSDGLLLRRRMSWGDRTEVLLCARDDGVFDGLPPAADYYDQVVFTYLKTTQENAPVRLDLPRWVLEAGELERVLDVVRAECIVGTGYPYALETADAVAVITVADRERFYRIFQEFVASLGVGLRYARKASSKRARR